MTSNPINLYRVVGPPGCGKTTFLSRQVEAAVKKERSVLIASLTRAAAAEVGGRNLPISRDRIGTLHAHAYRALDNPKIAEAKEQIAQWNEEFAHYRIDSGNNPDVDPGVDGMLAPASKGEELYQEYILSRARMAPRSNWSTKVLSFAQAWEDWKQSNGYLDFTDLIEVAAKNLIYAPGRPNVIFIDEAQDLDKLEMSLVRNWGMQADMLIIVGDHLQNLYHWRGSDPEAFLDPPVDAAHLRVLRQSWRVPVAVHATARGWIAPHPGGTDYEYFPRPEPGAVYNNPATWRQPHAFLKNLLRHLNKGKTVMLLTACSYMLAPLIEILRQEGIPFHNQYRRNRGDWNPLRQNAERVLAYLRLDETVWGKDARVWNGADLKKWSEPLAAKGTLRHGMKTKLDAVADTQEFSVQDLLTYFEEPAVAAMLDMDLDWLYNSTLATRQHTMKFPIEIARRWGGAKLMEVPQVTVGTCHSVKGGQADVVYLFPDLSRAGFEQYSQGQGPGYEAVLRQFYVGMTRARETLCLCNASSGWAVRW